MSNIKNVFNFLSFIAVTYFGFSLVNVVTSKDISNVLHSPTEIINFIVSVIGLISTVAYIVYVYVMRKEVLKNIKLDNELKKRKIDDCDKKQ